MKASSLKLIRPPVAVHITLLVTLISAAVLSTSGLVFCQSSSELQEKAKEETKQEVKELKPGDSIEREISGDATHSYRVALNRGQYLKIVVEQKGMDVIVRLFAPDGKQVTEVNSPNGTQGPELVSVIAEISGTYRVEVRSLEEKAAAGRYEFKLEELRESTATDKDRIDAERVVTEADRFRAQGTADSQRKAIEKYNEALPLWRRAQNGIGEAKALNDIGEIYAKLSEYQRALIYHRQSLELSRTIKDRKGEASALNNIGTVHVLLGELRQALDYLNQALSLRRQTGERQEEAYTSINIGVVYDTLGEFHKTLEFYDQALSVLRLLGDRRVEGLVLNNIGYTYFKLDELQKALEYYHQSLPLIRAGKDRFTEGYVLDNMGKVFHRMGEPQKALEYYGQSLEVRRIISDRSGQGISLHNIGELYLFMGELRRALEYFDQALSIKRQIGNPIEEAYTLDSMGGVYFSLGELQKALNYHNQSLSLRRAANDRYGEAYALTNIGLVYDQLGELQRALDYFDQSLKLRESVGDRSGEANTLHFIGSTYRKLREPDKALEYYKKAIDLSRAVRHQSREAAVLLDTARVLRERGNNVEARTQVERALNIIESTRASVASQELRSSYLAANQDYYAFYIDLLMQSHRDQPSAGYDALALYASERSRARSLLDILTESRVDIRQGVDLKLLDRERSLQQQLNAKSESLTRLLSGEHTEEQAAAARKEVELLLSDYQDAQAQIRSKSPRYAALTQPQPLSLKEIQQLLDNETILLEYALGKERSYLWLVTPTSIKSFELPKRSEIEAEAQRFYNLITSKENREIQAQSEAAAALSNVLLSAVARELGQKRLVIVSDGALHYIPFAALPVPSATGKPQPVSGNNTSNRGNTSSFEPLIVKHEIVQLSSASVLRVLREHAIRRTSAGKVVAVLADPVFQSVDPRVKGNKASTTDTASTGSQSSQSESESDVKRSGWESGMQDLQRLPFSRREAEAIVTFAPAGQSLKVLDFDASRETVTSNKLADYRIIHFATHGLLNNVHPELSGMVLSLVDQKGQPVDGFLRLHEIYNLNLSADLVVLSGCQTALGKEVKGEGLIGLTRGFMYAGAPRVVVSLWDVNDEATAQLMKNLYEIMLKKQMPPAAALRGAQLTMWKSKWWNAPYYWAGFVVQGEWR